VSLAGVIWKLSFLRGRYGEAEEVARRVLGLGLGPLEAAFFHDCLGVVERLLGRPTEALDSYRAAERELEGVAERDPSWWRRWIELKLDKAHFFYFENDLEAQQRVLEELEPAVAIHGSAGHRLDLLHARMQYRYRVERYALSEETEALARGVYELDKANGVVWSDFTLGFCLLWRGKLDEAESHLAAGLDAGRKAGIALLETRCLVYGLLVMRRQDRPESARERLAELEALGELHGYEGLVSACAAWLAYRDGDAELVARRADLALREWGSEGRLGYGVFQWTARFPLLGVAVDRGDAGGALDQARAMLDARQQPLPAQITRALEVAVASGRIEDFRSALDIAMPLGYA
jgi:tetratricopeptide (TPR) repeat protein